MGKAAGGKAGAMRFKHFAGIDWSGARGCRHPGIAVAVCGGSGPPQLVAPPENGAWSRTAVLEWLQGLKGDWLVGMDAGFGFAAVPPFRMPARALWAEVDTIAAEDPDLGAHSYVAARAGSFWTGTQDGPRHLRAHLRRTEQVYKATGLGTPTSNFVLLGASQVGKASLSAMRLLNRLGWPVWPFDPLPASGPVILEIYCQAFARMAGHRGKLREGAALAAALQHFGSAAPAGLGARISDHEGDALITAAGLRTISSEPPWWAPAGLAGVATTEGWTFGVA